MHALIILIGKVGNLDKTLEFTYIMHILMDGWVMYMQI